MNSREFRKFHNAPFSRFSSGPEEEMKNMQYMKIWK